MNDPESSNPLDLRFLPSWLKEENSSPNYSDHQGGDERPRRDRDGQRGSRPPGRDQRRDSRGPGAPAREGRGPGGPGRPGFKPGGPQGGRPFQKSGPRPEQGRRQPDQRPERPPETPTVEIQFLPEEIALGKVTEQILASAAAYPLFAVARMFLQRPERHHLRFTPLQGQTLFKINGTSLISTDRARLEAIAFKETRDQWFRVEITEAEEIKGNFTSVARSSLTGKIFGPTSHHTFQSAIRKEYEERFSRRMSFPEFRSSIETSSDAALVEQWKQESRRIEKYVTLQAETEQTFASPLEAELYFKKEILPTLIVETPAEILTGEQARELRDSRLSAAVRFAWDKEMKFPLGLVNEIRNHLQGKGLHVFKYKKRVLLVSTIRPVYLDDKSQSLSPSIKSILIEVREHPGIQRKELLEKLSAPASGEAGDASPVKNAASGDLYWLVRQGNIIEFADGTLDLPLSPKQQESKEPPAEKDDAPTMQAVESAENLPPQAQQPEQ